MFYKAELDFLIALFHNYHIQALLLSTGDIDPSLIDMGLRRSLGMEQDYRTILHFMKEELQPRQLCLIRDSFCCSYYFLQLPDQAQNTILSVGPFLEQEMNPPMLPELMHKHDISPRLLSAVEKYYSSVPLIANEVPLLTILHTFAQKIWGEDENFVYQIHEFGFSAETVDRIASVDDSEQADPLFYMEMLEKRYERENSFLQAVSQGLAHKAEMLIGASQTFQMEQRSSDVLRNIKNYCIILNTLLRKAAESGSVHPFYIDKLSSAFAKRIESAASSDACRKLMREMIRKYSLLVKNHSTKGYSLLIQKVIIHVDSDLTADLNLNTIAVLLNVNPSYLSAQFKRETGSTLTDYVNRRRIEYALLLLNSSSLQVQTIAQYCGIPDVNYFTKLFKKYIHKTPREYRAEIMGR